MVTPKTHKTLYRYDVKTIDGEDFVDAEAHSALMARYNDLVEQLEAAQQEREKSWDEYQAYWRQKALALQEQVEAERQRAAAYQASEREWRRIAQNGTDRLKEQLEAAATRLQSALDESEHPASPEGVDPNVVEEVISMLRGSNPASEPKEDA